MCLTTKKILFHVIPFKLYKTLLTNNTINDFLKNCSYALETHILLSALKKESKAKEGERRKEGKQKADIRVNDSYLTLYKQRIPRKSYYPQKRFS